LVLLGSCDVHSEFTCTVAPKAKMSGKNLSKDIGKLQ
jgi:hypothetical protein